MCRIVAMILVLVLLLCACTTTKPASTDGTTNKSANGTEESAVPELNIHPDRIKCTVPQENVAGDYIYKVIGERELRIIYSPPTTKVYEKAPVLLIISGGGFMVCSEEWAIEYMANEVQRLRQSGFAVASVEYRVGGEGVNVKQVYSDIADAMRYMSYYSDVFGIDPDKFITTGHSAGGSASLAMAYIGNRVFDTDVYWPEADYQVVGAFAMSGHGDYTKTDFGPYGGYCSENARTNVGLFPDEQMRREVSPVFYLEGSKVPCKILMGEMDDVVAPIYVEKFKEACDAAGVPCDVVWFQNAGHSYESMNGEPVKPFVSVQKARIVDFAKACVELQTNG